MATVLVVAIAMIRLIMLRFGPFLRVLFRLMAFELRLIFMDRCNLEFRQSVQSVISSSAKAEATYSCGLHAGGPHCQKYLLSSASLAVILLAGSRVKSCSINSNASGAIL